MSFLHLKSADREVYIREESIRHIRLRETPNREGWLDFAAVMVMLDGNVELALDDAQWRQARKFLHIDPESQPDWQDVMERPA